jgi:hypothetical protein
VHKDVNSSIVILEGDYTGWNDFTVDSTQQGVDRIKIKRNHTVLSDTAVMSDDDIRLITPLQLLKLNTQTHIPFSDRLLEYLVEACITGSESESRENVLMAQTLMSWKHPGAKASGDFYLLTPYAINTVEKQGPEGSILRLNQKTADTTREGLIVYTSRAAAGSGGLYVKAYNHLITPGGKDCGNGMCEHLIRVSSSKRDQDLGPFNSWLQANQYDCSKLNKVTVPYFKYDLLNGVWSPMLRKLFYRDLSRRIANTDLATVDHLGYVDKDVESTFTAKRPAKYGISESVTMLNFDAWEDIKE